MDTTYVQMITFSNKQNMFQFTQLTFTTITDNLNYFQCTQLTLAIFENVNN